MRCRTTSARRPMGSRCAEGGAGGDARPSALQPWRGSGARSRPSMTSPCRRRPRARRGSSCSATGRGTDAAAQQPLPGRADRLRRDLREDLDPGTAEAGVTPYLAGQPTIWAGMQELSKEDLAKAEATGFPIVALILLVVFGSLAAAALPLTLGFVSVLVTGALIYFISLADDDLGLRHQHGLDDRDRRRGRLLALHPRPLPRGARGRPRLPRRARRGALDLRPGGHLLRHRRDRLARRAVDGRQPGAALDGAGGDDRRRRLDPDRDDAAAGADRDARRPGPARRHRRRVLRFFQQPLLPPPRPRGRRPAHRLLAAVDRAGDGAALDGGRSASRQCCSSSPARALARDRDRSDRAVPEGQRRPGRQRTRRRAARRRHRPGPDRRHLPGGEPRPRRGRRLRRELQADRRASPRSRRPPTAARASSSRPPRARRASPTPRWPWSTACATRSSPLPALAQRSRRSTSAARPPAADDVREQISGSMWKIILFVLALSFLVLMVMLRSLLLPLKAVLMNLLSIGAAFGILVAIFQWGWLDGLLGFESQGALDTINVPLIFAIVFGLSMDYEVFLHVADPRALHGARRQRARRRRGPLLERPHDLLGGADHDLGLRRLRPHRGPLDQGAGPRLRGRDRPRRDPGPPDPGAGGDEADGRLELVDALLARPPAAGPQLRGRRAEPEPAEA